MPKRLKESVLRYGKVKCPYCKYENKKKEIEKGNYIGKCLACSRDFWFEVR